jgi:hypothetical protein
MGWIGWPLERLVVFECHGEAGAACHLGEPVIALAGIKQIGGEQRVERAPRKLEPCGPQRDGLPLEVVADLLDGRVGQHLGEQPGARSGPIREHLGRHPHRGLGRRQREARGRREQPGLRRPRDTHRKRPGRPQRRHELRERVVVAHVCRRRLGQLGDRWRGFGGEIEHRPLRRCGLRSGAGCGLPRLRYEALKAEFLEERAEPFAVGGVQPGSLPGHCQGHVGVEPYELAAGPGRLGIRADVFLPLLARHDIGMREHVVERAVRLQQFRRDLRADERHPGHVVGGIAHEREIVDDLVRADAPLGAELIGAQKRIRAQVEQPHAVREQLPGILVGRGEHAAAPLPRHQAGERGQDVVGLVARHLQARDPHHVEQLPDERNLWHEVGRHLGSVRLVGLEPLVAKRRPGRIECAHEIVGLPFLDDVEQVAGEAVDRGDGRALRRRHLRQRVKQLVDPRKRIDHPHRLAGKIGHGG